MDNIELGNRIKHFRSIYNRGGKISSAQLAHRLDISPDALRNYESGRSSLPLPLVIKLHEEGLSMHWLLTGKGLMFSDNPNGKRLIAELDEAGIYYDGKIASVAAGDIKKDREDQYKKKQSENSHG